PLLVGGELVGVIAMFGREPMTDIALNAFGAVAGAVAVRVRGRRAEETSRNLEDQLRQSQKMEAVGRLAGGVAHDFNNMLSVVLSYSDMMIADLKKGDPIRDDILEIRRAGQRAAELTRQLLMFSRQQVVEPRVLDLNGVLSSMGKMLERLVGEDVELTSVPAPSLGYVRVDPGSIEQVIMNLVVNARDAMPTGGRVTIETANAMIDEEYATSHLGAKPGAYVMISVSDTGTGMDKTTLARIFEPFFTTKEKGKGTGLGLSTVFGIVQQCDGSVWVYSEPGVGTTFKVYVPRVDAVVDEFRVQQAPAKVRGTETVLLVEDEEQVRDVARGILRRHGYTVLEARNAGEALLLCERHPEPIHLLLSDVVMPQMSGPDLAQRLVRLRPDMKVLCMSGYTDDAAVRHGVVDANLAYLQKPLTVEMLTRKVREVLDCRAPVAR
ncbi:MAG TPA: ATP-binding protein, partial [Polyangiaceae bacterium]